MKKIINKTIIGLIVLMMIFALLPVKVFASSYADNYQGFLRENPIGTYYTPKVYSKNKTLNQLFIEDFYENVFLPISINSIKATNGMETSDNQKDYLSLFSELYAGDILKLDGYYAIYLSYQNNTLRILGVGLPMSKESDDAILSDIKININDLSKYVKSILVYQVNKKDYNILSVKQSKDETFIDWGMPNISKNTLKITKGTKIPITIINQYKDGSTEESVGDYTFTSSDTNVAYVSGNTLIAKQSGITYLSATSKTGNYATPDKLKIQVVEKSVDSKYLSYWGMQEIDSDILYTSIGDEIDISVLQKRGTTLLDITNDLSYRIADTSIAYIKNKKIIPIRNGETTITASSYSSDISAPQDLIIKVGEKDFVDRNEYNTPRWNSSNLVGKTLTLVKDVEDSFSLYITRNNQKIDVTDDFTYQIRNTAIARVTGHKITPISSGTTTLVATPSATSLNSPTTLTIIVLDEERDEDEEDKETETDEETRNVSKDSYYTYWSKMNVKDNVLELFVGQSVNVEVGLQSGLKQKYVTDQVSLTVDDKNVAYLRNGNILTANSEGTTVLHGKSRGNFAPNLPDLTVVVKKQVEYSKDNLPIWTISSMESDRLRINLSNYTPRHITTGTVSTVGLNDTTSYMTFETKDPDIINITKEGTIIPLKEGQTYLYAYSRFSEDIIPEPLLVEVYSDPTEDGFIYITVGDSENMPEILRLSPNEEVPFKIYMNNFADDSLEDCTNTMMKNIEIDGDSITIRNGQIYGKKIGISTIWVEAEKLNVEPIKLKVEVRELDLNKIRERYTFSDVSLSYWGYDYITELAKKGIINGFEDKTFRPTNNITAEQALKMIVLAAEKSSKFKDEKGTKELDTVIAPNLSNVKVSEWAKEYLDKGLDYIDTSNAFTSGFVGTDEITRVQVFSLLLKSANIESKGADIRYVFNDFMQIPSWSYYLIENLYSNDIISGDENSNLRPYDKITRAEMSKLLYKVFFENTEQNIDEIIPTDILSPLK